MRKILARSIGAVCRANGNAHCDNVQILSKGLKTALLIELCGNCRTNKPQNGLFSGHYHIMPHPRGQDKKRPGFSQTRAWSSSYFFSLSPTPWVDLTTTPVRANRAMALGMTIRLLNISVSSHTRSLDITVPRKMKTRAMTE